MESSKNTMLIIMDGWGLGRQDDSNAIFKTETPFINSLYQNYPHTTLVTCGEDVGLPDGQMGNSEVGHLNLGAGRIVYQELQRINVAIKDGSFMKNEVLLNTLNFAKDHHKKLHVIGLVSNGGVHSHINHLEAICQTCDHIGLQDVFIHAFTDGRDCDPKSGLGFIKDLQNKIAQTSVKLASICGRYYAMDRDQRWERVQIAYHALVHGKGVLSNDPIQAIQDNYDAGITDEFLKPIIITNNFNEPQATIQDGDVVICFNFRTDRCREITQVLTQTNMPDFNMQTLNLYYTTMTCYDHNFKNLHTIFENDDLNNTLGEIIANNNLKQIRIAETEKYPHVTYFFSGGRENPFPGEERIMVPSPKVATYDLQPDMSAFEVTAKILPKINSRAAEFICLNFANTDMVGHTGVFKAVQKAVQTVDACV